MVGGTGNRGPGRRALARGSALDAAADAILRGSGGVPAEPAHTMGRTDRLAVGDADAMNGPSERTIEYAGVRARDVPPTSRRRAYAVRANAQPIPSTPAVEPRAAQLDQPGFALDVRDLSVVHSPSSLTLAFVQKLTLGGMIREWRHGAEDVPVGAHPLG